MTSIPPIPKATTPGLPERQQAPLGGLHPSSPPVLAAMPPEDIWFTSIDSAQTRRAYAGDVRAFRTFTGIGQPEEFRQVTREHILAWRTELETQGQASATIRRKLASVAWLYDFFIAAHAVANHPVVGVSRPKEDCAQAKTPALSDSQAHALLEAPPSDTLKGKRDRAILSMLIHHGLRSEELTQLRVGDIARDAQGALYIQVRGKAEKQRSLLANSQTVRLVGAYLAEAGHGGERESPLFRRTRAPSPGSAATPLTPGAVYSEVVVRYMEQIGIRGANLGPHALRATAASKAIESQVDLSDVQEWLGHAHIGNTKTYDRRDSQCRPAAGIKLKFR